MLMGWHTHKMMLAELAKLHAELKDVERCYAAAMKKAISQVEETYEPAIRLLQIKITRMERKIDGMTRVQQDVVEQMDPDVTERMRASFRRQKDAKKKAELDQ